MSDQEQSPAPAAPSVIHGTSAPAPTSGGGKRTALVVIVIVTGVLLVCGCAATAGLIAYRSVDFNLNVSTTTDGVQTPEDAADATRIEEWRAWEPELAGDALDPAPSAKQALIDEALGIVAPDFETDRAYWIDGYYDEADEWYYADYVVLMARHAASDAVWAGVEYSIQSDLMLAEGIPFDIEEGDVRATIEGGAREILYYPTWDEGVDETLWRQIGEDWPDAVVMFVYESEDVPGALVAEITNPDAYAIDSSSPRVYVTYEPTDDGWRLYQWQYWTPKDSPEDTPEDTPDDGYEAPRDTI